MRVLCLSGSIASGKTTLARALYAQSPNSACVSFGDVVRTRASAAGLPLTREVLQDVGMDLVAQGWPTFVDGLLATIKDDFELLIVDGIRHLEAYKEIQERFPMDASRLFFLRVDEGIARERMTARGESPSARGHEIERDLLTVERHADIVCSGKLPIANIVLISLALVN